VRLGTRLPFAQVAEEMASLFGVIVSADTVRRLTEQAGALQVAIEQRELERLEHDAPPEPAGPAVQQVSADGAMVPLVGGVWTEARTIAIGTIEQRGGEGHVTDLSYFSRRCSADQFIRQTTVPTHERGTRRAGTVVAVSDGANWLQELVDEQCPQAVRILDFPHAVGYLSGAAQAAFGAGSRDAASAGRAKRGDPLGMARCVGTHTQDGRARGGSGSDPCAADTDPRGGYGEADGTALSPGEAGTDPVRDLSGAGLSDWEWHRGECLQAGGRSTAQRQWHVHSLAVGGAQERQPAPGAP